MTNDKKGTNSEFPTIKPAPITLTRDEAVPEQPAAARGARGPVLWLVLALLLIAALVVFVLPEWVAPVTPPAASTPPAAGTSAATAAAGTTPPANTAKGPGPWSEAQQERLRKQSQDLLQQMLDSQDALKQHGVQQWAANDYKKAMAAAKQGDDAYAAQHFGKALNHYRSALDSLKALQARMPQVYAAAMQAGGDALNSGDAGKAQQAFATALLIRPGDAAARKGKQRASTLDQVNALIRQGDKQRGNGKLEAAKATYRKALDIDQYDNTARQRLGQVNGQLRENAFRAHMSAGYAALDKGKPEQARRAFAEALKIKSGAGEARAGMEQAEQQITNRRIQDDLDAAHKAAAAEDWSGAIKYYTRALSLDDSLAAASQGLATARRRATLDQRLEETIKHPLRLADNQVFEQAKALGREALAVDNPGPRLKGQIAALAREVQQARTPVRVPLRSDNQTHVVIYKVGDLGQFDQTSVKLTPGHYVAVGSRSGYRDVRVEFTVQPGQSPDPVTVEVNEQIGTGAGQ